MNDSIEYAKSLVVAKRNDMAQRARFNLSVQEQRAVLYAIAQIKPEDKDPQKIYEFELKDLYELCGIEKDQGYERIRNMLTAIRNKGWTAKLPDKETDVTVAWFSKVWTNKNTGKVRVLFDPDMMPFLLELSKQYALTGHHYTQYALKYVLPMQSKFSLRLYELLKSYQQNNVQWFFLLEDLQALLCDCNEDKTPKLPAGWKNFAIFRRDVIEPAIKEINQYTDLRITYKTEKIGRKIGKIHFMMLKKTDTEIREMEKISDEKIAEIQESLKNDPFAKLMAEQRAAIAAEQAAKQDAAQRDAERQKRLKNGW